MCVSAAEPDCAAVADVHCLTAPLYVVLQETFYDTYETVLNDKLVPVTAVLFIAVILQFINIFITICVIRTARKVRPS